MSTILTLHIRAIFAVAQHSYVTSPLIHIHFVLFLFCWCYYITFFVICQVPKTYPTCLSTTLHPFSLLNFEFDLHDITFDIAPVITDGRIAQLVHNYITRFTLYNEAEALPVPQDMGNASFHFLWTIQNVFNV